MSQLLNLLRKILTNNLSQIQITLLTSCLFVCLTLSFPTIQAATQGAVGSTSSGTIELNVVIDNTIVIRDLRDFNFGLWNLGDGTLTDNDDVCIGKTEFGAPYAISASGDGDGIDPAAFTLSNGTDQIYYNVYWNDATGVAGNVQLTPGLILNGQTGSVPSFAQNRNNCNRPNANLEIEITNTELQNANSGNYTGTLTLLVIPN